MEKRKARHRRVDYWKIIDKLLFRLVFLLLIIIILTQTVLIFTPQLGTRMNTALRLEGEPLQVEDMVSYAGGVSTLPWASLSLKVVDYVSLPEVKVLVDGREISGFLNSEVTINVRHGNIVSVQNPNPQVPVTVIVSRKTPNVLEPPVNSRVRGTGTLSFEPVVIK